MRRVTPAGGFPRLQTPNPRPRPFLPGTATRGRGMPRRGSGEAPAGSGVGTGWWRERRRGELTRRELEVEGEAGRLAAACNTRLRQPAR